MSTHAAYPPNVGIVAMEVYFPKSYVSQAELEKFDNAGQGKYTAGLGQTNMAFVGDREDIYSICLTAVQNLLDKYKIPVESIGRLEVGTETIIDKSKSVKSVLMQLFEPSGNTSLEGVDTYNACYGGTNAFFNAVNWVESSSWDGRYALVVAGDIAVYAAGPARPTGGCGAVAMLIGQNAPLVVERGLRGTHMENVYDFYKPKLDSEYPLVDGHLSNVCYLRALDNCYRRFRETFTRRDSQQRFDLQKGDYFVFHSPYNKLVQKSFARLVYNDFVAQPSAPEFTDSQQFLNVSLEKSYTDRELEAHFLKKSRPLYDAKVASGTLLSRELGNLYCGSLWIGLASLIAENAHTLLDKRIVMFSYGSGLAASMFALRPVAPLTPLADKLNLRPRLAQRVAVAPDEFVKTLNAKEKLYGTANYKPADPLDLLFPGTFYLKENDAKYRRTYNRTSLKASL